MSDVVITYPVTPQPVDEGVIQPSSAFRQEVLKVLGAIIFFMLVYVLLMSAALALAALCATGGFFLVVNLPRLVTIMIGVGLIGLGILVVYFLLKFLFKRNKVDRSHLIEITEQEQPELFAFIRRLTRETQAPFPKRVYLSADVNACVFYDSSFWSMFFPVRKNLQIGLGLVNAVNMSEFKAILAHEFGHFSQRSMKLGSYVYNVNHVIYNMLYDNEGYGKTLQAFAEMSGYFAFFAGITVKIVAAIQWILQKVYTVINRSYRSLSRQMEFHADAVAAYVSGSAPLVSSLRRLELADSSYNRLFDYYNLWFKDNLKPDNLYPHHLEMMQHFAEEYAIPVDHGLPQVDAGTFAHFNKTRVVVKDQWASHPSTDDREAHLNKLNIHAETIKASAWTLFRDVEALQKRVTEKIYSTVTFPSEPQTLDLVAFRQRYFREVDKYRLNKRYKGFFNARSISKTDLRNLEDRKADGQSLDDILDEKTVSIPHVIDGLKSDIQTLEMIASGGIPVKTFEFNGARHKKSDAATLVNQLKQELAKAEDDLVKADADLIAFFLRAARTHQQQEVLRELYSHLFVETETIEAHLKRYVEMMQDIQPIYYQNLEFSHIRQIMHKVKLNEVLVKDHLRAMLADPVYSAYFTAADRSRTEAYLQKEHEYFREPEFNNEALSLFNDAVSLYQYALNERLFSLKKELLEKQLTYLN